jgi:hypothetical protein
MFYLTNYYYYYCTRIWDNNCNNDVFVEKKNKSARTLLPAIPAFHGAIEREIVTDPFRVAGL